MHMYGSYGEEDPLPGDRPDFGEGENEISITLFNSELLRFIGKRAIINI